ncbi:MAG: protease modulator HflC [Rhodospirillales bacterium]|nr:protease modulator HflC [Rhodospirillales bacterium]
MKNMSLAVAGIVVVAIGVLAYGSLFTVHQIQQALILQFGNPVHVIREPGLNYKLPFIQDVMYFDRRILDLDPPTQEVILADQKRVNVDSFARYKIVDPLEFRKKAVNDNSFRQVFGGRLNSAVRAEVGRVLLGDMLTEKRAEVMERITQQLKSQAADFGIEVVDVRIGRTDLPEDISKNVYERMRTEREREANLLRAEGEEAKQRITAAADREKTVIIAEAQKQSEILRGEGEGARTTILNDAFGKDPEFFALYRSLEAYQSAFGEGTTMVLHPDSEFFRFFGDSSGKDNEKKK